MNEWIEYFFLSGELFLLFELLKLQRRCIIYYFLNISSIEFIQEFKFLENRLGWLGGLENKYVLFNNKYPIWYQDELKRFDSF